MIRFNALLALVFLSVPLFAQQPAPPDPFQPLHYFVGEWRGTSSGEAGKGTAERTYEFTLNGRFLRAKNKSVYPPQEANKKGETHEDLGIFSFDRARKKLVLRQFHVEGFVNTYVQQDGAKLVFATEAIENIPPGWRARESYTIVNDNEFIENFDLAEPGQDFKPYSEAHFRRVTKSK